MRQCAEKLKERTDMAFVMLGNITLTELPQPLADRVVIEHKDENTVEITFVSPDGLAGSSKTYRITDVETMRKDIAELIG